MDKLGSLKVPKYVPEQCAFSFPGNIFLLLFHTQSSTCSSRLIPNIAYPWTFSYHRTHLACYLWLVSTYFMCSSQSEMSYFHCTVTVSSSRLWDFAHKIDVLFIFEASTHKTEIQWRKCIELVQDPQVKIWGQAGISVSFVTSTVEKLKHESFLRYLMPIILRKICYFFHL